MFLLLVFAAILHQAFASIRERKGDWPMRIFFGRCIEFVGRLTIFPVVAILFLLWIRDVNPDIRTGMIVVLVVVWIFVFIREIRGLNHTCKESYRELIAKLKDKEILVKELSTFEILVINYYQFDICSCSPYTLSLYLNQGDEVLALPETSSIPIRKYAIAEADPHFPVKVRGRYHHRGSDSHVVANNENLQLQQPPPTGENKELNRSQSSGSTEINHSSSEEMKEGAAGKSQPAIVSTSDKQHNTHFSMQNGQFKRRRFDSDDDLDV
jgi:hypothetical protein